MPMDGRRFVYTATNEQVEAVQAELAGLAAPASPRTPYASGRGRHSVAAAGAVQLRDAGRSTQNRASSAACHNPIDLTVNRSDSPADVGPGAGTSLGANTGPLPGPGTHALSHGVDNSDLLHRLRHEVSTLQTHHHWHHEHEG